MTRLAQEERIKEWVKTTTLDIPVLGIKLGISDAGTIGGLGLFILSIWFFFSTRRENHVIAMLLRDTENETLLVKTAVFHGIVSALVFITVAGDEPIKSLKQSDNETKASVKFRGILKALFFLAPFAICFIASLDILTLIILGAPFRHGNLPLWKNNDLQLDEKVWGLIVIFFSLLIALATGFVCWFCLKFETATESILKQYAHTLGLTTHEK